MVHECNSINNHGVLVESMLSSCSSSFPRPRSFPSYPAFPLAHPVW